MKGFERAAKEEADRWAEQRGITGEHAGMRAAMRVAFERIDDPEVEDRDRLGYLRFATERFAGKPREVVEVTGENEMTDEQYREELALIAADHLASLTPEERERLVKQPTITQPGTETVQ